MSAKALLSVENLRVMFQLGQKRLEAVRGVSFDLGRERLAIVGESGSGKSMTVRSLLGLAGPTAEVAADRASFGEIELLKTSPRQWEAIRGRRIALVVQDPRQGLNPVRTVSAQVAEMLRGDRITRRERSGRVLTLLEEVGIQDVRRVATSFPNQLSGGMAQRVMIAMMLAAEPEILIADEATSALDVSVQYRILDLIDAQVRKRGMGLILISHDLELVSSYADRILVMYGGRIIEELRDTRQALHPYTRGLIACRPKPGIPAEPLPTLVRNPGWLG